MPVLDVDRPNGNYQHGENEKWPLVDESSHSGYFFLATAFISDSSTTGAGPEIPPAFRIRQKCTAMKIEATRGIPMQCQMYERKSAFESTIEPPSNPKRTSLYAVKPSCGPNGPS